MSDNDFEQQIQQALIDHGGPPEIAPQLIALADLHELTAALKDWIIFHNGSEWRCQQFDDWCRKFKETKAGISRLNQAKIEKVSGKEHIQ